MSYGPKLARIKYSENGPSHNGRIAKKGFYTRIIQDFLLEGMLEGRNTFDLLNSLTRREALLYAFEGK
jgi:hypothetical protein